MFLVSTGGPARGKIGSHQHLVWDAVFALDPSGRWIAVAGKDCVHLLDAESFSVVARIEIGTKTWALTFTTDEKHLLAATDAGELLRWDLSKLVR
jgi:hypothetical protein